MNDDRWKAVGRLTEAHIRYWVQNPGFIDLEVMIGTIVVETSLVFDGELTLEDVEGPSDRVQRVRDDREAQLEALGLFWVNIEADPRLFMPADDEGGDRAQ